MREFYWITRLDTLEGLFGFFIFLGVIGLIIYIGFRIYWSTPDCQNDETERSTTNTVLRVSITVIYKYILRKYFVPIEDGFALKGGADPSKASRKIATYGSIQMIVNAIILIAAIISLILC